MRNLKTSAFGFAALVALLSVCLTPASGQQAEAPVVQRLFLPGMSRALDLDLRAFQMPVWEKEADGILNNDGRVREFVGLPKLAKGSLLVYGFLKIRIEPARVEGGAAALRVAAQAERLKLEGVDKGSFKQSEYNQTLLLRYKLDGPSMREGAFPSYSGLSTFPIPNGSSSFPGWKTSSRALEAFLVHDGAWVTLRYLSPKLGSEEEKLFYALLDSVKFVDVSKPSSSYEHFLLGRDLYRQKEHGKAVAALEQALALEQKKRELTQPEWRDLVMTLANALGATDNTTRAREVLEYGIGAEPTYPYFHHGLSRLYSYFGDLDRVLASLEKAYQYEPKNSKNFVGWPIPDPMLDPAFQKYKDDPKFRDTVKALKKKYKN